MKIAVFGNYGVANRGDDLILMGLRNRFEKAGTELMVFCGNPEQVRKQFQLTAYPFFPAGFRSWWKYLTKKSYRQQIQQAYQALEKADLILIGGGGILVDRHLKAIFLWWKQLKTIKKTATPYRFISNSLELRKWWAKKLFLVYLRAAEHISVRDKASLSFLQSSGLVAELVPDLAYEAPLPDFSSPKRKKSIVLALCKWGVGDRQVKAFQQFIKKRKEEGFEVVGIAMQSQGDDDQVIFSKIDEHIPVFRDLKNILEVVGEAQLLVGMRLHSLIIADRLQTPFIGIAYQQKVRAFMKDQGKEDQLISIENLDEEKLQLLFQKAVAAEVK